ncbi:hypothetical protein AO398_14080 [Methylobacterium sp. GXS13]|jgi:hypothetical protein|uniref:restriction endonuclease n=1 Tax=Methylobacterium sp. GXS13 TaxID=1730094 RepID=UPI00071BA1F8|nr:restriction endonuclease [Methylobacterium sp. GXS13]KST60438.1 hypothetical protein AO398_14080 [Methylobacterium sp. GXS13]
MAISDFELRKPRDWQAFERAMLVLLRHELGDAGTQLNGRSGQAQSGVDISGQRTSDSRRVGMQCKRHDRSLTERQLRDEVELALTFRPRLDEFILATTAEKDVAIEKAARLITKELRRTSHPMTVSVWSWGDIEQRAAPFPAAIKAFDPTWTSFAEQTQLENRKGFRRLGDKLDKLSPVLKYGHANPQDVRLLQSFRDLVSPDAMRFLAQANFRFPVLLCGMVPFNNISENWLGAHYEFVDPEMQRAFGPVMSAMHEFVELVGSRIFSMDENPNYGSPVTSWDLASGTARDRREGASIINDTAHVLWRAVDKLERLARSKGL